MLFTRLFVGSFPFEPCPRGHFLLDLAIRLPPVPVTAIGMGRAFSVPELGRLPLVPCDSRRREILYL
jgi:hypothetical protein